MSKKVLLCILDGFGKGKDYEFNAVANSETPNIDKLFSQYPSTSLVCSGNEVGLPEKTMGNSEVGHLNIGAGRIVYQDITRIDSSIKDGSFARNKALEDVVKKSTANGKALHLMGLVSDGNVHSSFEHLKELIKVLSGRGSEKLFIHVFTDGRDTPPESGAGYVKELENFISDTPAKIASVSGRYYAMDRDKRWERIKKAYDILTSPEPRGKDISALEIIKRSYSENITDEFIAPAAVYENEKPVAKIEKGDGVIFFNFRADRAREISIALNNIEDTGFEQKDLDLNFITMTEYREDFPFPVISGKQHLDNILGEAVSKAGRSQLRIAETEKYAHVTFFFNGGDEKEFPGEDRILIPSPKVATYDLKPEMSAYEVTDRLTEQIATGKYDLIVLNFANCDMVGHSGIYEAAVKAVEAVDECLGSIVKSCRENDYTLILTADHGNAEYMMDGKTPFTAHTKNKVPFLVTLKNIGLREGKLGDIAPTVLGLLDIPVPDEMTGNDLII